MRISTLLVLAVLTMLASCGGSSSAASDGAAQPPAQKIGAAPSVSDVLAKIYDPDYLTPSNFFVDARATTQQSYTMHHVLDASGSFELCTDDFTTALQWEDADNASRAVRGQFVEAIETNRYFEIARELAYNNAIGNSDVLTSPGFSRVFKCSNTQRDGVNRNTHEGFAGWLNLRPLSEETVREFSEYLWQFAYFPTARKKVLDTSTLSFPDSLQHSLMLGFASGDPASGCDRIEVIEWSSSVDRQTGAVNQSFTVLDTFLAKLETGGPVLCN